MGVIIIVGRKRGYFLDEHASIDGAQLGEELLLFQIYGKYLGNVAGGCFFFLFFFRLLTKQQLYRKYQKNAKKSHYI